MTTYQEHVAGAPELDVVELSETEALRSSLLRLQQDVYALQQTLNRVTNERDSWRANYYRVLKERAEQLKREL